MKAETARIAAIPGLVACDRELACRSAGKPFVFDPFVVGERVGTGGLSAEDVNRIAADRKIHFEKIDPRVDDADLR